MSAMGVVPLRDAAHGAVAKAKAPPPLPGPKAPPSLLPSMRVPKGTISHAEPEEAEDWEALVTRAKSLAAAEDAEAENWDSVIASARARAQDEEREWAEALARAKRIEALESPVTHVGKRPQRPQRPPRPARKPALVPPPAQARVVLAPAPDLDEEAEWQRMRAQAGLRLQAQPRNVPLRAVTDDVFGAFVPAPAQIQAAPRVVAWP